MYNFLNLCYPNVCGICEKISNEYICNKCRLKIKQYTKSIINEFDNAKYFNTHAYMFAYDGIIRMKIIRYKFLNSPYLYKFFSNIILNDLKLVDYIRSFDVIIPVPIHKKRKKKRGYNQSELIAKEISKKLKIQLQLNVLYKNVNNSPQSTLNQEQRKYNTKDVYILKNKELIKNKNILIFDDIYTTGNTVNECSKIIRNAQVNNIGVLTIAKD